MLKKFLVKILHKLGVLPGSGISSWVQYRDYVCIHPTAIIAPSASIKIFNPPVPPRICLEIGEGSHIFSSFSLLRPEAHIKVGKRCQLGNSHFISADSIEVGDDVVMSWGVTVMDSDNHSPYWNERKDDVERCRKDYVETIGQDIARTHDWTKVNIAKVIIKNKCLIGFNVSILKGVTIGDGAIIGAGSVVTRNIEPWHIGAGNPFKTIRKITESRETVS
jgi:galactoside O-acetyltransferase